jgi:glycosyltransferase involved in cell wall biosynthesis
VSGAALTDLMANAKLLIAPSVCYENCPLSILEAHSLGVPVVTMNSGGMAELVDDGKTGGLAYAPTAQAVAETVKRCLDDGVYQILKENCRQAGEDIMDVRAYCQILLEKYNNLKG